MRIRSDYRFQKQKKQGGTCSFSIRDMERDAQVVWKRDGSPLKVQGHLADAERDAKGEDKKRKDEKKKKGKKKKKKAKKGKKKKATEEKEVPEPASMA